MPPATKKKKVTKDRSGLWSLFDMEVYNVFIIINLKISNFKIKNSKIQNLKI